MAAVSGDPATSDTGRSTTPGSPPGTVPPPPRERAQDLRREVTERVAGALAGAAVPPEDVYVGWSPVVDAARCPAGYRAQGAEGWGFPGWSPALAAAAAGRAALVHHLDSHGGPPNRPDPGDVPVPDPVGTVRAWMSAAMAGRERSPVGEWVAGAGRAGERATLAATAATASRWLAGFLRVLGWPLSPDLRVVADDRDNHTGLQWRGRWRPGRPARGVTVASRPDAVLGRVGTGRDQGRQTGAGPLSPSTAGSRARSPDGYTLVVHRPVGPDDGDLLVRAAFEAVAAGLATGDVPAGVTVTIGDTGERVHVAVDDALLAQGVEGIVEVVHQRALATTDAGFGDARPSVACRRCPAAAPGGCPDGQRWLAGDERWRAGLPVMEQPGPPGGRADGASVPVTSVPGPGGAGAPPGLSG